MATPYAGNDVFPVSITSPDDGDTRNAAAQNIPDQGLADRTTWLQNRRTTDVQNYQALKATVDALPAVGFTQPVAQSLVDAAWNENNKAWFGIDTTSNCRFSFTAGWAWPTSVALGTDTLSRVACDPSGNTVVTRTAANTTFAIWEYNVSTGAWTRRVSAGILANSSSGSDCVVFDPVSGLWCHGTYDVSAGNPLANLMTSPDRVTWTTRAFSLTQVMNGGLEMVSNGLGTLMFVGRYAAGGVSKVFTSSNGGVSWTARTDVPHGYTSTTADLLIWNATLNTFVVVASDSSNGFKLFTSPDGVSWSARATSTTRALSKIATLGSSIVGVFTTGLVALSVDGGFSFRHTNFQVDIPTALKTGNGQLLALCTSTVYPSMRSNVAGLTVT